jgi:hypothetical protein
MSELQIKIPTTTPTTNQNMMIQFGKPQKLQVHGLANNIIILSSCIKSSQKWHKLSLFEVSSSPPIP